MLNLARNACLHREHEKLWSEDRFTVHARLGSEDILIHYYIPVLQSFLVQHLLKDSFNRLIEAF